MPTHILTTEYSDHGTASAATLTDILAESGAHFVQVGNNIFVYGDRSGTTNHYYALGSNGPEVEEAELILNTSTGSWNIVVTEVARTDGDYPSMTVGNAHQIVNLDDDRGSDQDKPFLLQATATDSNTTETATGPIVRIDELRGQSYVKNQLCKVASSLTSSYYTYSKVNDYTYSLDINNTSGNILNLYIANSSDFRKGIATGDKVLIYWDKLLPSGVSVIEYNGTGGTYYSDDANTKYSRIMTIADAASAWCYGLRVNNGVQFNETVKIQIINLTRMFGTGNEPESLVEFIRLFPTIETYNTGSLVSSRSSKLVNIGYNQFDGEFNTSATYYKETNDIKVIAGQSYTLEQTEIGFNSKTIKQYDGNHNLIKTSYLSVSQTSSIIKLEDNCQFVHIVYDYTGQTVSTPTNVCFHLTWDKTGYEPYKKKEYTLPDIELKSARNAYDSITSDGLLTRRIGSVNLGEYVPSTVRVGSNNEIQFGASDLGIKANSNYTARVNLLCSKYRDADYSSTYSGSIPESIGFVNNVLCINSAAFAGKTGAQIKALLSGVMLYFELANPVESQSTGFTQNVEVDDYGTMEFVSDYPQGYLIHYPADYVAMIDDLYLKTDGDMSGIFAAPLPSGLDQIFIATLTIDDQGNKSMSYAYLGEGPLQLLLNNFLADKLTAATGYNASADQVLSHDANGNLKWISR